MKELSDFGVAIQPFDIKYSRDVVNFIVGIQQNEFNIPISASDQPDLSDIPNFYQNNLGNFWVATCDDHVVGTIALLDIGDKKAALRKMFVDAAFRGNEYGTAKKLIDTLISWAERQGVKGIFLGTTPKFLAAHKFYEKNGFIEIQKSDLPATFPIMTVDTKFYRFRL